MNCLLCQSASTESFKVEKNPVHSYFHCQQCDLIFMEPDERPQPRDEKARYDLHQNEDTEGYRKFLEPLANEIVSYADARDIIASDLKILDYGCGPTAFFGKMLDEYDFKVANYDIYYYSNQRPLQNSYDVITSTEVWEHFFHPFEEITQLVKILNPDGMLAIMTSAHSGVAHFQDWHYRRDLTHVIFFSEKTMKWVAESFGLELVKAQNPYWIFRKKT